MVSPSEKDYSDNTNHDLTDRFKALNNNDEKREEEQERIFYKELLRHGKKKLVKYTIVFAIISVVLGASLTVSMIFNDNNKQKGNITNAVHLNTGYLIQNLRGDTVDTWVAWKRTNNEDPFHIHILQSPELTQPIVDAIHSTIMSSESINIDDSIMHKGPKGEYSKYYLGWYGALNSIANITSLNIPKNIHFHVTPHGEGDIIIKVTNLKNPDGYDGFTKSFVDEANHQILKSEITIYEINKRTLDEIRTIARHELGHALGLAHSTAPEDLMAPIINTPYPLISQCDLDAIISLYNGNQRSTVLCQK